MEKLPSISDVVPISEGTIPLLVVDFKKYICTNGSVSPVSPSTTVPDILVTSCAITIPAKHKNKNMYLNFFILNYYLLSLSSRLTAVSSSLRVSILIPLAQNRQTTHSPLPNALLVRSTVGTVWVAAGPRHALSSISRFAG